MQLHLYNMAKNSPTAPAADSLDFHLYRYTPSLPAAIAAVAVFGFLTAYHCWLIKRHKSFYFIAFVVGGICKYIENQEYETLICIFLTSQFKPSGIVVDYGRILMPPSWGLSSSKHFSSSSRQPYSPRQST